MPIENTEADAQNLATLPSRPLLVISNDPHDIQSFKKHLGLTYRLQFAHSKAQTLTYIERHKPPIALLDLALGQTDGNPNEAFAVLSDILRLAPQTKVIAVTELSRRADAVRAVGQGAYDFYHKPVEGAVLSIITNRAFRWDELEQENRSLALLARTPSNSTLVGASPAVKALNERIDQLAKTNEPVLVTGESGVGKDLVAKALHDRGSRADRPLIALNCAAVPPHLLTSELFGAAAATQNNEATTDKARPGKLDQARGGTLVISDIADLPLPLQTSLLDFIVKQDEQQSADNVRLICATNRELQQLSAENLFLPALLSRFDNRKIDVPPLRDREDDLVALARSFIQRFNVEFRQARTGLAADAVKALQEYQWPENVRELESRVKRGVVMAEGPLLTAGDLGFNAADMTKNLVPKPLREVRALAESAAVQQALNATRGNISAAAKLLAVSRPTLYDLMKRYHLKGY